MNSSSCRALARSIPKAKKSGRVTSQAFTRRLATAVDAAQKVAVLAAMIVTRHFADEYKDPIDFGQITTLPNGIRVATEALPGPFSGVGVYVDGGSRYEDEELRGVSHIIDRLAFKVC